MSETLECTRCGLTLKPDQRHSFEVCNEIQDAVRILLDKGVTPEQYRAWSEAHQ